MNNASAIAITRSSWVYTHISCDLLVELEANQVANSIHTMTRTSGTAVPHKLKQETLHCKEEEEEEEEEEGEGEMHAL
jgi:hypothetical protein